MNDTHATLSHARIQKVLPEESRSDNIFYLVDEGSKVPNTTMSGPSSTRQRNAFRWHADDGPTSNAGLVALWFSEDPDHYC